MSFFNGILNLLFPPRCVFCRKQKPGGICRDCRRDLPWRDGGDSGGVGLLDALAVPLTYSGKVRDAIKRFKFNGRMDYAAPFGELLAAEIKRVTRGEYDLLTWVPVSDRRKRTRGYDQSMLLASATALALGEVAAATLDKVRDNPAQSRITDSDERAKNVKNAYRVTDPELVSGKRILLIDDVYTTGATMQECAATLLAAGAASVSGAALAAAGRTVGAGKAS